jgi:Ras-related protein Rab-6A
MVQARAKICFIGADGSGKTSLILRYTKNTFSNSYLATIGCDFYEIGYQRGSNSLQVYLWDIASQINFEKMRQYYLSYSNLIIICVDVTRYTPEFVDPWILDVKKYVGEEGRYLFSLDKIDLITDPIELNRIKSELERRYKMEFIPTSAKTGEKVRELFDRIGSELWTNIKT